MIDGLGYVIMVGLVVVFAWLRHHKKTINHASSVNAMVVHDGHGS